MPVGPVLPALLRPHAARKSVSLVLLGLLLTPEPPPVTDPANVRPEPSNLPVVCCAWSVHRVSFLPRPRPKVVSFVRRVRTNRTPVHLPVCPVHQVRCQVLVHRPVLLVLRDKSPIKSEAAANLVLLVPIRPTLAQAMCCVFPVCAEQPVFHALPVPEEQLPQAKALPRVQAVQEEHIRE